MSRYQLNTIYSREYAQSLRELEHKHGGMDNLFKRLLGSSNSKYNAYSDDNSENDALHRVGDENPDKPKGF